jgi:two-component system, OmpR family, sensor kinase
MRAPSLRATLLASFAYVLLLVIVALEVPLVLNLSRRVDAEVKAEAAGQAQLVAATAGDDRGNGKALNSLVHQAGRTSGGRVIIVGPAGRLEADSAGSGLGSVSYASRPEIAQALRGDTAQGTRQSDSLNEQLLFTAVPIVHNGEVRGAVRVTQSVEAVHDEIRKDAIALIGVGAVALLLGVGVAWLLAGFLSRPPETLAVAARRVAEGDLEARAPEVGPREQREVAAAFNEMTGRLAAALAAQRDFVSNASHQLRTPLTGLRLRIEAAADLSRDESVETELRAAEAELERLSELLTSLLALARGDERPAAPRPVDVARVAADAGERWLGRADETGHSLEFSGDGPVDVLASAEDLALVLDNLIENAITYSPSGSAVVVEWGRDGTCGYVAVSDEGPGLAPGEESRVLERFHRGGAGRGKPGTGLGLPIVRAMAERWRGSLRLANREVGGLRAEVRLPLASTTAALPKLHAGFDDS